MQTTNSPVAGTLRSESFFPTEVNWTIGGSTHDDREERVRGEVVHAVGRAGGHPGDRARHDHRREQLVERPGAQLVGVDVGAHDPILPRRRVVISSTAVSVLDMDRPAEGRSRRRVAAVGSVRGRAISGRRAVLGAVADAVFADPARWHPVAGFGTCAAALERRWYADRRAAGVAHTAVLVAGVVSLGVAAERGDPAAARRPTRSRPPSRPGRCSAAPPSPRRPGARRDAREPPNLDAAGARSSRRSADGTRSRSTQRGWPGPASSRWPRTRRTPSSRRCCGAPWRACPGCSATARSTRWTRWSATARRATAVRLGRGPHSTTW